MAHFPSLRGAQRRGNPAAVPAHTLDRHASLAMTVSDETLQSNDAKNDIERLLTDDSAESFHAAIAHVAGYQ